MAQSWWKGCRSWITCNSATKKAKAENFRKMITAIVQDIRVVLIKLAERPIICAPSAPCGLTNGGASRANRWKFIVRWPTGWVSIICNPSWKSWDTWRCIPTATSYRNVVKAARGNRRLKIVYRHWHSLPRQWTGNTSIRYLLQNAPERVTFSFHQGCLHFSGDCQRSEYLLPGAGADA